MTIGTAEGFTNQDGYTPDRLFAGDHPRETTKATLLSGENVSRGAVPGIVTASGKLRLSASGSADGSETPDAIAAEDADATGGDVDVLIYRTGEFNQDAVTLGTGHTVASISQGLRERGIFLKPTQAAAS